MTIHYSKNDDDNSGLKEIEDSYKEVIKNDQYDSWKCLERESKMICEEMNCLVEIYSDFSSLVSMLKSEKSKLMKNIKSYESLKESNVTSVGFFKKKSKEDKLNDLLQNKKKSQNRIELA